ncbi:hypothetical protein [Chitinimonas sp. BJYL2]|uniref:hypothetical protein n=1 Tax=Chitinimonas sp. BJYL2 TaxID=2976696 RepID=UPI0022B5D22B|nr:hypothetical protein [Chitinimonas sp. BJYL2]
MPVILRKTEAGQHTLQNREGGVRIPPRLRALLLQVDGQRDRDALLALMQTLGTPEDSLDKLTELGLIEIVPGTETPAPQLDIDIPLPPLASKSATKISAEAEPSARAATAALLAQALEEVGKQIDEPGVSEPVPAAPSVPEASVGLTGKSQTAAEKMLGVAALIPGPVSQALQDQIRSCRNADELHLAIKVLRRIMKNGYRDDDADRILQPILRMLPAPTTPVGIAGSR